MTVYIRDFKKKVEVLYAAVRARVEHPFDVWPFNPEKTEEPSMQGFCQFIVLSEKIRAGEIEITSLSDEEKAACKKEARSSLQANITRHINGDDGTASLSDTQYRRICDAFGIDEQAEWFKCERKASCVTLDDFEKQVAALEIPRLQPPRMVIRLTEIEDSDEKYSVSRDLAQFELLLGEQQSPNRPDLWIAVWPIRCGTHKLPYYYGFPVIQLLLEFQNRKKIKLIHQKGEHEKGKEQEPFIIDVDRERYGGGGQKVEMRKLGKQEQPYFEILGAEKPQALYFKATIHELGELVDAANGEIIRATLRADFQETNIAGLSGEPIDESPIGEEITDLLHKNRLLTKIEENGATTGVEVTLEDEEFRTYLILERKLLKVETYAKR